MTANTLYPNVQVIVSNYWLVGVLVILHQLPIHHSKSYSAECGASDSLSSSQIIPRIRTVQSSCCIADEQKKHKKRKRRKPIDDTSGYSTTSLSELSEFENSRQKGYKKHIEVPVHRRQESIEDDRSERSRVSKLSLATSRHGSETSKTTSASHRVSELSKGPVDRDRRESPYQRREQYKNSPQRPPSRARSTSSLQSEISVKSNQSGQSRRPRSGSQQFRKDSRNTEDRFDPFAFIQPVPEPFSRKMKKTLGPIFGILLLLILAASLGAAIYFAVELKKNQDTEIEMLRASLDLKIKNTRFGKNLDELTQSDFKMLALDYCQQMDNFYKNSHFQQTYRGCEVVSIKNEHINFTLFFIENAASKKDIISVIETSAPKVQNEGTDATVALVDKFEIELENARIKIEHERTPVNFNKIIPTTTTSTTTTTAKPTTKMKTASTTITTTKLTTTATTSVLLPSTKVKTSTVKPTTVESASIVTTQTTITSTKLAPTTTIWETEWTDDDILFAWEPCYMSGGNFHPHPIECNKYFQCEHSVSLERTCAGDTVFDSNSNVCVPDRPGIVCPDPGLAPPKPPALQTRETTSVSPSSDTTVEQKAAKIQTKRLTRPLYPARPEYDPEPCVKADEGTLHAHPEDCSKFIQCISGGSGVVLTCAKNLVYDPESSSCIFPRNELICPDILPCLGKNNGYFSHPFNCSLYIQCQSGREVIQQCSSGLVWDPSVNSCVFRTANAACEEETKKT